MHIHATHGAPLLLDRNTRGNLGDYRIATTIGILGNDSFDRPYVLGNQIDLSVCRRGSMWTPLLNCQLMAIAWFWLREVYSTAGVSAR